VIRKRKGGVVKIGPFAKFRLKRQYMKGYEGGIKKIEDAMDGEAFDLGAADARAGSSRGASFDEWFEELKSGGAEEAESEEVDGGDGSRI